MQPIATQLGHCNVLGLVLASDQLCLCDEVIRDRERCVCVWRPWLGLLLVCGDGLGEELGETTRGCAEVNGGGSCCEEIVELGGDIGFERGWGSQKFGAGRRLDGA
jgi:hypothetical protein